MSKTRIMFGELGARVMVEDREVEHYAVHVDPVKKEAFSIVWLELDVEYPSDGILYLDGHRARSIPRLNSNAIRFQDTLISDSSRAPFLFSPLVVTDDDTFLDTSSSPIGEIKLVINRTTVPQVSPEMDQQHCYSTPPQVQKVHERSKKAIVHQVSYGNEIPKPRVTRYYTKPTERLVTFIFKYRPLEMLQANEIIPRNSPEHSLDTSPSPEASSGKRQYCKTKEEVKSEGECEDEDSKREKALLAEVERIRKRRRLKDPKKMSKKEDKTFFIPGEIIDLT